jgi:phage terminase large subunit
MDRHDGDKFAWVWEGAYRRAIEGAYYADGLSEADKDGRVMPLALEPLLPVKAFWDLGIADSMAIWVAQWVGREIRWLDYIEGQGQPLAYYVAELRKRGWNGCECVLPHDGVRRDMITGHRFSDHLRDAGFSARVVENQGRGAAMLRIEAGRRLCPRMVFDADKTRQGRKTLALYHERRDEDRGGIGLGPEHDASSHCGDAFGLGCIAYEEPQNAGRDWKFESRAVY